MSEERHVNSEDEIIEVCDGIKELLLSKNRKYGDSALNPSRIFSRSDAVEQIKVRIDDKLTRLQNQQGDEDEDVVQDLIGYLVLLTIAKRRVSEERVFTKKMLDDLIKPSTTPPYTSPSPYTAPWNPHPWEPRPTWDQWTIYNNCIASEE